MSTSLDFQASFSSLRAQPRDVENASVSAQRTPETSDRSPHRYPITSPSISSPSKLSPIPDKQPVSTSAQTNESSNPSAKGLLSLLNFGQLESGKENTKQPSEPFNNPVSASPQVPAVSASDLVARYWSSAPRSDGTNLQFSGIHHDG